MPELPAARVVVAAFGLVAATLLTQPAFADDLRTSGTIRFEALDDATFSVSGHGRYVDTLELRADGTASVLVNELSMEDYVLGIAEMPSRWHLEALKAQAVAARTYAWYSIGLGSFDGYDICASVACQVFRGADVVLDGGDRWREAVEATAGEVLLHDGEPALARYFSTSGGRTYANEVVFPRSGARPYLVAIEDPDDAVSPYHRWEARFTREEFDTILARGDTLAATVPVAAIERLGDVDDQGALIRVTGEDGTQVEVGARDLRDFLTRVAPASFPTRFPGRRADGLRPLPSTVPSTRFLPVLTDDEVVLRGRGWGHGVGLGQYGALGRAERGESHRDILSAYYNGLLPVRSPELPERIRVGMSVEDEVVVTADGAFGIVADDLGSIPRTLGGWTIRRDGEGWLVTPPMGHDERLEVAATRPASDAIGPDDAVTVETEVNKPVLLRMEVRDAEGRQLLSRDLGAADPGVHAATWRFEDASGAAVAEGDYLVTLAAEDAAGQTAGTPLRVSVTTSQRADGPIEGPGGRSAVPLVIVAASALGGALVVMLAAKHKEPT